MRYVPKPPLPASNVVREKQLVQVQDIRGSEAQYSLDKNGFMVTRLESKMVYEDFDDQTTISKVYLEEAHDLLSTLFPNSEIDLVSYLVIKSVPCRRRTNVLTLMAGKKKRAKLSLFDRRTIRLWPAQHCGTHRHYTSRFPATSSEASWRQIE